MSRQSSSTMLLISVLMAGLMAALAGNFYKDVDLTWGDGRAKIIEGGRALSLNLDNYSGSGFQSKNEYLFGRFDMQLKLVPGNCVGPGHDEIDFEFLGNASGEPYTVHTNVYSQGKGDKEQQFKVWFDPTAAFHTYSIVWNPQRIIFLVDNSPLRVFNNHESIGIPFPKNKPMRVLCSLWNADDWATQGGKVKTDWTKAPFTAYYRNVNFDGHACVRSASGLSCGSQSTDASNAPAWKTQDLDANGRNRLRWVHSKHKVYDYCADTNRFPQGISPECKRSRF